MPDTSPFTSARNTGTPAFESCSASSWSDLVLPVPVAPAMSPCRCIIARGRPTRGSGWHSPERTGAPSVTAAAPDGNAPRTASTNLASMDGPPGLASGWTADRRNVARPAPPGKARARGATRRGPLGTAALRRSRRDGFRRERGPSRSETVSAGATDPTPSRTGGVLHDPVEDHLEVEAVEASPVVHGVVRPALDHRQAVGVARDHVRRGARPGAEEGGVAVGPVAPARARRPMARGAAGVEQVLHVRRVSQAAHERRAPFARGAAEVVEHAVRLDHGRPL